jgi:hypothetical protein
MELFIDHKTKSLASAQILLQYSQLSDNIFRDFMIYFILFVALKGFIYLFIYLFQNFSRNSYDIRHNHRFLQ